MIPLSGAAPPPLERLSLALPRHLIETHRSPFRPHPRHRSRSLSEQRRRPKPSQGLWREQRDVMAAGAGLVENRCPCAAQDHNIATRWSLCMRGFRCG